MTGPTRVVTRLVRSHPYLALRRAGRGWGVFARRSIPADLIVRVGADGGLLLGCSFGRARRPNLLATVIDGHAVIVPARTIRAGNELLLGEVGATPRHACPRRFDRRQGRRAQPIPAGLAVRPSAIHGLGLFVTQAFDRGATVCMLTGPERHFVSHSASDAASFPNWIALCRDRWVEPTGACLHLNHSCAPNVLLRGRACIALDEIVAGEELTLDYAASTYEPLWRMVCKCGKSHCAGVVTAKGAPVGGRANTDVSSNR